MWLDNKTPGCLYDTIDCTGNCCKRGKEMFNRYIEEDNMKYRVKFKCYHYNTGYADNGTYMNYEDFDTIEESIVFKERVEEQHLMTVKYRNHDISFDEYDKWEEAFNDIASGRAIKILMHAK